ncbi:MAG TPA: chromate transporter [Magnetospirillaceae bacterium]|nr:chromate transporter [Magnetospirillaceae bacterium]
MPTEGIENDPAEAPRPELWRLAAAFARVSLSSFGGGNSGWIRRELVERHGWLSSEDFLAGLALSQILPGATTVNLAVHCGARLRGAAGAIAAGFGVVLPPMALVLAIGVGYGAFGQQAEVQHVLAGLGAAAIGLTLQMGVSSAWRAFRRWFHWAVALAVIVAVGWLRWPILPVLAVLAPLSIGLSYFGSRR